MQYAEYLDHMGDDLMVVNAARQSFDKRSEYIEEKIPGPKGEVYLEKRLNTADENLIRYLATGFRKKEWKEVLDKICFLGKDALVGEGRQLRDAAYNKLEWLVSDLRHQAKHWVPFAHPQIQLRMKAPVPIRTQAFKHKQGFVESEESRRYVSSTPEIFYPVAWREKADDIKQGSGGPHPDQGRINTAYKFSCDLAVSTYLHMLEWGACEEQARFVLPQGTIVNWVWTGSLAAYARFYNQRWDKHAQKEAQDLAEAVGNIIEPLFPYSWKVLTRQPKPV